MITSMQNSTVKELVALRDKAKARRLADVFLIEGSKMFEEAPVERIRKVYVSESFYVKCTLQEKLHRVSMEILSDEVFAKVSDTVTPQGILCVLERFHYTLEDLFDKALSIEETPLFLALEDLQDPGNLGTILRTGEGAGVHGIIMSQGTVDIYNPKTIRSTMGSIYRVPFLYVESLTDTIGSLKEKGVISYAAHLQGKKYYDAYDYRQGTVFLIGNEGRGLQEKTAGAADTFVKVPMHGQVESLNAGVTAALLAYEADRQRRSGRCEAL